MAVLSKDAAAEQSFKPRGLYAQLKDFWGVSRRGHSFDPKIRGIHYWPARRPCSLARATTLASALKPKFKGTFEDIIGPTRLSRIPRPYVPLLFYVSPDRNLASKAVLESLGRRPEDVLVVDPMAGGGSIPLEALRLGFRTIAMEYNPVAYLILKATVEFPAKYAGSGLFDRVLREAEAMIAYAKRHLAKFYSADAENYILARGIKCPFGCKGIIPANGLGNEIAKKEGYVGRFLRIAIDKKAQTFVVETCDEKPGDAWTFVTVRKKGGVFTRCPYCNQEFKYRGRVEDETILHPLASWFTEHSTILIRLVEGLEGLNGLPSDIAERVKELHIPLVKQVGNSFLPAYNDNEIALLVEATEALGREALTLQPYLPLDEIPKENRWASTARGLGITKWYMLFNPRQLYVLGHLIKYVNERAKELVEKEGEFGAAVALYLGLALGKLVDYNNIATRWHRSRVLVTDIMRGETTLDLRNEYCEMVVTAPGRSLEWILEPHVAREGLPSDTQGGVLPILRFLSDEFKNANLGDRVSIYLADATELSALIGHGAIDIINVDPPYFEQNIYSDKSELFWAILRRALEPALELLFKPGLRLKGWSWVSPTVPRDKEVVERPEPRKRRKGKKKAEEELTRFERLFSKFVKECYLTLKDDGVLFMWFTHPTAKAWYAVGQSLYDAGFVVSRVYPLWTEIR